MLHGGGAWKPAKTQVKVKKSQACSWRPSTWTVPGFKTHSSPVQQVNKSLRRPKRGFRSLLPVSPYIYGDASQARGSPCKPPGMLCRSLLVFGCCPCDPGPGYNLVRQHCKWADRKRAVWWPGSRLAMHSCNGALLQGQLGRALPLCQWRGTRTTLQIKQPM